MCASFDVERLQSGQVSCSHRCALFSRRTCRSSQRERVQNRRRFPLPPRMDFFILLHTRWALPNVTSLGKLNLYVKSERWTILQLVTRIHCRSTWTRRRFVFGCGKVSAKQNSAEAFLPPQREHVFPRASLTRGHSQQPREVLRGPLPPFIRRKENRHFEERSFDFDGIIRAERR
jgi:hypothetical protein